jgi:hypothetical protein
MTCSSSGSVIWEKNKSLSAASFISNETKDLFIRKWIELISRIYGIDNVNNHHQCHLEKPSYIIRPFHINYFFGCTKCGKYHFCCLDDPTKSDCELVSSFNSDLMICRFSGRTLNNIINYAMNGGSHKESTKIDSDSYHHNSFDYSGSQNINFNNISDNKYKLYSSSSPNSNAFPSDDKYSLHVHKDMYGSYGAFVKKKTPFYMNTIKDKTTSKRPRYASESIKANKRRKNETSQYTNINEPVTIQMESDDDDDDDEEEFSDNYEYNHSVNEEDNTTYTNSHDGDEEDDNENNEYDDDNEDDRFSSSLIPRKRGKQLKNFKSDPDDWLNNPSCPTRQLQNENDRLSMLNYDNYDYDDNDHDDMEETEDDNLFKQGQLNTIIKNTHNNIIYWTNYYSFIDTSNVYHSNDEDNDDNKGIIHNTIRTTPVVLDSNDFLHDTVDFVIGFDEMKILPNTVEKLSDSFSQKNAFRENEKFIQNLNITVRNQIEEEVDRLLTILLYMSKLKKNFASSYYSTSIHQKNDTIKATQSLIDKLKEFYVPIISSFIILIYNSPILLEWEKEKNIKHQKQVKSACQSKRSTSITNLSHIEETEKDIDNSRDTFMCPRKICQTLMLKYFLKEHHLPDSIGNFITITTTDKLLSQFYNEGIINDLISKDSTHYYYNYTNDNMIQSLNDVIKDISKVIKKVLIHYSNNPIWLKAFIFK